MPRRSRISPQLFETVQSVIKGHHKGKYRKHDIAFRGLLTCAHDDCRVTAGLKKGKYVITAAVVFEGNAKLPRFREEQISEKLGDVLKNIHIPDAVLKRIQDSLQRDQLRLKNDSEKQRERLQSGLDAVRRRMDQAYTDKLDGKIPEDFWQRKMGEWRSEEQQIYGCRRARHGTERDDGASGGRGCVRVSGC